MFRRKALDRGGFDINNMGISNEFYVRRGIREVDLREVMVIERASYGKGAWGQGDLLWALAQQDIRSAVMMDRSSIIGFILWKEDKESVKEGDTRGHKGGEALNLAVSPSFRKMGVGRRLLDVARKSLWGVFRVRALEHDLESQLFLRSCGYLCTSIGEFEGTTFYHFESSVDD